MDVYKFVFFVNNMLSVSSESQTLMMAKINSLIVEKIHWESTVYLSLKIKILPWDGNQGSYKDYNFLVATYNYNKTNYIDTFEFSKPSFFYVPMHKPCMIWIV